jgi:hypothetical protein
MVTAWRWVPFQTACAAVRVAPVAVAAASCIRGKTGLSAVPRANIAASRRFADGEPALRTAAT